MQTALERLAIVEKERQEAIEQLHSARRRSGEYPLPSLTMPCCPLDEMACTPHAPTASAEKYMLLPCWGEVKGQSLCTQQFSLCPA